MAIPGLKTHDELIDEIAAKIWEIPVERLKTKTRKREVVEARMTLMVYRNRKLKMSQNASACKYGLGHGSTIHACKTVDSLLQTDKNFKNKYEEFCEKINV